MYAAERTLTIIIIILTITIVIIEITEIKTLIIITIGDIIIIVTKIELGGEVLIMVGITEIIIGITKRGDTNNGAEVAKTIQQGIRKEEGNSERTVGPMKRLQEPFNHKR